MRRSQYWHVWLRANVIFHVLDKNLSYIQKVYENLSIPARKLWRKPGRQKSHMENNYRTKNNWATKKKSIFFLWNCSEERERMK